MEKFIDHIPAILILLFIAITFLQSGLDKVFDGNGESRLAQGTF